MCSVFPSYGSAECSTDTEHYQTPKHLKIVLAPFGKQSGTHTFLHQAGWQLLVCHSPLPTPGQPPHSSTTCSHEGILIIHTVLRSTVRADHTYSKESSSTRLSRQHIHKEPVVQYMQPRDRAIWYFWGLGSGKNSAKSVIQSLQNEVTVPFLNRKYFSGRIRCGRKDKSEKQFCPKLHKWQRSLETNKHVSFSWKSSKLLL